MFIAYVFTFHVCAVNGSPITEACIDSNWWRRWRYFSNVFSKRKNVL
jgi:hypothetical protein